MKYSININQLALSELSSDLDVFDAAILDYAIVICRSSNEKIEDKRHIDSDGGVWTWLDFGRLLNDMPLLRFKSRGSLTPRIRKLEKNGFLSTLMKRSGGHKNLYIKMNRLTESLFIKVNRDEKPIQLDEQPIHVAAQETEKPIHVAAPIIILDTQRDNYTRSLDQFDTFWQEYPVKKAKKVAETVWRQKISPELALMIIEDVKKRKLHDGQWTEPRYIPHPATYLRQERWNDETTPLRSVGAPMANRGVAPEAGKYDNVTRKNI